MLAAKPDRALAAQALIRMGDCYQKQGDNESKKIFERVLHEYPDQKDAVSVATAHLNEKTSSIGMISRLVWGGPQVDTYGTVSPDGRYIFFSSDRLTGSPHIWRMDVDGGNLKQLTNGQAENFGQVTPDGQAVIYVDYATLAIAKVSVDGGPPTELAERPSGRPSMSPDGKLIAYGYKADPNSPAQIALMPSTGGAPLKLLDMPLTADLLSLIWTPDSRAVAFV